MKVDIWTDIVCPFCYIGNTQFNKALDSFAHKDSVEVTHHSFQLNPDAPHKDTGVKSYDDLAQRKGIPVSQVKQMQSNIQETGAQEGLTMNVNDIKMVNSFDGHRLIHLAASHGKQDEAVTALFEAYFTDTKNIAQKETLVTVGESIGLNPQEIIDMLDSTDYTSEVKEDINQAASIGIQGVPFFVVNNTYGISGARGIAEYSNLLQKAWHEKHPLTIVGGDDASNMCLDETCA